MVRVRRVPRVTEVLNKRLQHMTTNYAYGQFRGVYIGKGRSKGKGTLVGTPIRRCL